MNRRILKLTIVRHLSDALAVTLAGLWLGIAFIPMLIDGNNAVGLMEPRGAVLGLEIGLCCCVIAWGIRRIKRGHES